MKRFEIVLEAMTCLLMVLVLAVLVTLVKQLRNESPRISLSYDEYVDEEAIRINKDYEDITQKAYVLPYKSAQTNGCYNIDGKPYKFERMKEDECAYVQPEIITDGYLNKENE